MNRDPSKLQHEHRQQEQSVALNSLQEKQQGREFATVEEMIRCDVEQTPVPAAIAERLSETIAREPKAARPWWRRLFSRHGK